MPEWLAGLTSVNEFPVDQVLSDSVFYPASNNDYYPIYAYSGFSHRSAVEMNARIKFLEMVAIKLGMIQKRR